MYEDYVYSILTKLFIKIIKGRIIKEASVVYGILAEEHLKAAQLQLVNDKLLKLDSAMQRCADNTDAQYIRMQTAYAALTDELINICTS